MPARRIVPALAALLALLALPCPASAAEPACSRAGPGVVVRQADLPPAAREALPRMADPGQPFQKTDVIGPDPGLPFRRMVCAYPADDGFVVEWERGGIAYGFGRTVLKRVGAGWAAQ